MEVQMLLHIFIHVAQSDSGIFVKRNPCSAACDMLFDFGFGLLLLGYLSSLLSVASVLLTWLISHCALGYFKIQIVNHHSKECYFESFCMIILSIS